MSQGDAVILDALENSYQSFVGFLPRPLPGKAPPHPWCLGGSFVFSGLVHLLASSPPSIPAALPLSCVSALSKIPSCHFSGPSAAGVCQLF